MRNCYFKITDPYFSGDEMAKMFDIQYRAGQFTASSGEIWEQLYDCMLTTL